MQYPRQVQRLQFTTATIMPLDIFLIYLINLAKPPNSCMKCDRQDKSVVNKVTTFLRQIHASATSIK